MFKKGDIKHYGYNSDISGRILPVWRNVKDPRSRDSSEFHWRPVHPDLYVPEQPARCQSPDPPPVWETEEDIKNLIAWLNSLGCNVTATEIRQDNIKKATKKSSNTQMEQHSMQQASAKSSKKTKHEGFSYLVPKESDQTDTYAAQSARNKRLQESSARKMWEEKLNANTVGSAANAADFTRQFMQDMYEQDTIAAQESSMQQQQQVVSQQYQESSQHYHQEVSQQYYQQEVSHQQVSQHHQIDPPALPPKTKIMNSPSRSLFSPTESIESNGYNGTATVKTVEFLPVKEKVKLIAAQQEELLRKEESETASGVSEKKKGVRILPPSPVTVRKMSVDDELYHYDEVVKRSTPVTQVLEKHQEAKNLMVQEKMESRKDYSSFDSAISKSVQSEYSMSSQYEQKFEQQSSHQVAAKSMNWESDSVMSDKKNQQQDALDKYAMEKELPRTLDQLVADNESVTSSGMIENIFVLFLLA